LVHRDWWVLRVMRDFKGMRVVKVFKEQDPKVVRVMKVFKDYRERILEFKDRRGILVRKVPRVVKAIMDHKGTKVMLDFRVLRE